MTNKTLAARIQAGEFENKADAFDRDAFWKENLRLSIALSRACAGEYGIPEGPIHDAIWRKAWNDGHGHGYQEVRVIYEELARIYGTIIRETLTPMVTATADLINASAAPDDLSVERYKKAHNAAHDALRRAQMLAAEAV